MNLTPSNLVTEIGLLPTNVFYNYPHAKTKTKVRVVSVTKPVGPIRIERKTGSKKKEETISVQMIQRYANSFGENIPINIDRVLGASYNTRSSLEALLANTPEFFVCYPKRIEMLASSFKSKKGHKHLLWNPDPTQLHPRGEIKVVDCNLTISERPSIETVYGIVEIPPTAEKEGMSIEVQRRHTQIQIALAEIGHQLGYRTWIAANDQGIEYNKKPLLALPGVIPNLAAEKILSAFGEAVKAARLIDCVWFQNGTLMPAVLEVEHSTGVTSGLTRMQTFKDLIPPYPTRWVIVAPDEDRTAVMTKASVKQFSKLNAKYFSYSAVEELHSLCKKRRIKGVTEDFLDCFMENCLTNLSSN